MEKVLIYTHKDHIKGYGFIPSLDIDFTYGVPKDIISKYSNIESRFIPNGNTYHYKGYQGSPEYNFLDRTESLYIPMGDLEIWGYRKIFSRDRTYGSSDQLPDSDSRQNLWSEQREKRGFDDTELWNLDITLAKFLLPRLKAFKEYDNDLNDDISKVLDDIIIGIEHIASEECCITPTKEAKKSIKLLSKHLFDLWN